MQHYKFYVCIMRIVDYVTWSLVVNVLFNVSSSVGGRLELIIPQIGLRRQQNISLHVNYTAAHIHTSVTRVSSAVRINGIILYNATSDP